MKKMNKNASKKCNLCGSSILMDENDLGHCEHCGWANVEIAIERPYKVFLPNFVSFDRAKQLYKGGLSIEPNFDEFLEVLEVKGKMSITFKDNIFEVIKLGDGVELFDARNNYALSYDTSSEFKEYAKIDGIRIFDIWNLVEKVDCLQ